MVGFCVKILRKKKITDREMTVIRMTAQGMHPKSIARIEKLQCEKLFIPIGEMLRPSCIQKNL